MSWRTIGTAYMRRQEATEFTSLGNKKFRVWQSFYDYIRRMQMNFDTLNVLRKILKNRSFMVIVLKRERQ